MDTFKTCPTCAAQWEDRKQFLGDPCLKLLGYQSTFTMGQPGLFLFNHSCGSTIALEATTFEDIYDGDIYRHCEAHYSNHADYCCKADTGEKHVKTCVCQFATEMATTLQQIMNENTDKTS